VVAVFLFATVVRCFVGCDAGSPDLQALHVLECDTQTGAAHIVQSVKGPQGTTYFQVSPDGRWLYSVVGRKRGSASGKSVSAGSVVRFPIVEGFLGDMEDVADLPCEAPCHVAFTAGGTRLAYAAYCSATAGTLALDGSAPASVVLPDDARGPNAKRQQKAYAHQAFNLPNGHLGIVDLGCDRVRFFDPVTMMPAGEPDIKADPGDGPRHALLSKGGCFLYILNELDSSVVSYAVLKDGKGCPFRKIGKWSLLPEGFDRWGPDGLTLTTKAAAIKATADGKILMASNRGHDSIAIFAVNTETGVLTLRNIQNLTGSFPRDFAFLPGEKFVIVGHKTSNEIRIYAFDRAACTLTPVGTPVPVYRPLCFGFAPISSVP